MKELLNVFYIEIALSFCLFEIELTGFHMIHEEIFPSADTKKKIR